jgi:outer membrane cobalamin receptor
LRKLFIYIAIFFSCTSFGQKPSLNDTIRINEVVVKGKTYITRSADKITVVDSFILKDYSHDNISDVISENTSIFIKNYGSGGSATISLRGTGAGYTQLAWNGVNVNSPMLGQTDLSLIPAGFIDDINILYGSASLSISSGGMGGTINFETKPVWKKETDLLTNFSAGSFGKYSALMKVKTGTTNFQSSTKALFQSAENNFPYLNNLMSNDPVSEKRKNASLYQNSFMQEVYLRGEHKVVSARLWYQKANRNIPVPIVNKQPDNGENQSDESFRSMINYSGYKGKTNFNSSLSWFSENMNYKNPLLSIDSRNLSNTISLKSGFETNLDEKTSINFIVNDEISIVNSGNYEGKKSRNLGGITLSGRKYIGERIGLSALIRESLKDNSFLNPDFSAGLEYRTIKDKDDFIHASFSRNSKVPTLNDMYWNPGGNPLLRNEYSYTGELSYEMTYRISSPLTLSYQGSLYAISIFNMIKWTPGESGYWSPSNIDKANSFGADGSLSLTYTNSSFSVRFNAKYGWNQSHTLNIQAGDDIKGKQLVYMPEHLFNAGIRSVYKNYYFSWMSCFTSKRFTTADNSDYLPGYLLNNLSTGMKLHFSESTIDINLKVDNLFNVNYQTIAWYPMPGRSLLLSLIYQFTR